MSFLCFSIKLAMSLFFDFVLYKLFKLTVQFNVLVNVRRRL
jgi:hypothetical protein